VASFDYLIGNKATLPCFKFSILASNTDYVECLGTVKVMERFTW